VDHYRRRGARILEVDVAADTTGADVLRALEAQPSALPDGAGRG
jgi:hypothetical protein